jgi:hypothetical protein
MYVLHVQHEVSDYDRWKELFDSDPLDRAGSGVRRYRIMQPANDQLFVIVDLEFEREEQAQAMLNRFKDLWDRLEDEAEHEDEEPLLRDPRARVYRMIEERDI